jgi:plastocyanin domain-containing protein
MPFSGYKIQKCYLFCVALVWLTTIIIIAGCGTPGKNLPVSVSIATIGSDNVQVVNIEVASFYFKPSRIQVTANVPVRLVLKSSTFIIPHNFSLHAPEAGIDFSKNVGHGKKVVVEFTPTKPGEYQFFCGKDGHAKKGMTGILVVKDR